MKQLIVLTIFLFGTISLLGNSAYLRSNTNNPWGQSITNETAMDLACGVGEWDALFFETVDPTVLFSSDYTTIFLEGSEDGANEFFTFYQANLALIEAWVENGGRLFANAAPNEGSGGNLGFGGFSLSTSFDFINDCGIGVDGSHPIFNGPNTPSTSDFMAFYFGHAIICPAGLDVNVLIQNCTNDQDILVEYKYGNGLVMFGGMTTSNFHCLSTPECTNEEARNVRNNIVDYLKNAELVAIPTMSQWALFLLAMVMTCLGVVAIKRGSLSSI